MWVLAVLAMLSIALLVALVRERLNHVDYREKHPPIYVGLNDPPSKLAAENTELRAENGWLTAQLRETRKERDRVTAELRDYRASLRDHYRAATQDRLNGLVAPIDNMGGEAA